MIRGSGPPYARCFPVIRHAPRVIGKIAGHGRHHARGSAPSICHSNLRESGRSASIDAACADGLDGSLILPSTSVVFRLRPARRRRHAGRLPLAARRSLAELRNLLLSRIVGFSPESQEYKLRYNEQLADLVEITYATLQLAPTLPSLPDLRTSTLGIINPFEGAYLISLASKHFDAVISATMKKLPSPPIPTDLSDQPIPGIKFAQSISYPLQPFNCSAALYRGSPHLSVFVFLNRLLNEHLELSSIVSADRISLVDFGWRCAPVRIRPYKSSYNTAKRGSSGILAHRGAL